MTPAPNQRSHSADEFETEAEKMVAEKSDATLAALIRGIEDLERAREYQRAVAESEDPSTDLMAGLNGRIRELRDRADADTEVAQS